MDEPLQIKLLGGFRAMHGDDLVTAVDTPRLQALLAYITLHHGTPQPRQHIAFTFWPDSTEKQALTNLRQLLHHLRHALPGADRFIEADTKNVLWKSDVPFSLDVTAFEQAIAQADHAEWQAAPDAAERALEEAVRLYAGDLLPSCYDEWIAPERERLRQHYLVALDRLVTRMEERRAYPEAIRYARLLLQKDPLRETTYRSLMRLHAVRRDRASALRVYHECVTVLERELGVMPVPATRELHERLLNVQGSAPVEAPAFTAEVPLVGRQAEWKQLQAAWHTARNGRAHVAYIAGEAGIGKTRLAEELLTWTGRQGITTARSRCYAAEGRLAFAPVLDWLHADAIRKAVRDIDAVWRTEVARILPELLTEDPQLPPPQPLTEGWQRRRFFEALARSILAAPQPMVLLIDDLQWCDRDTLEWMHFLLRFDPAAALLIVGTARVEEVNPEDALETLLATLRRTEQVSEVPLGLLNAEDTARLAEHVADRALNARQTAHLYRETEGHPLFLVEGVRAGLVDGAEQPPRSDRRTALPPKVHAILAARLAQLSPPARELAQVAAVAGRAFTFDVLAEASGRDEDTLVQGLDELWQRRIVREYGTNTYDFSHDKLREVAYAEVRPARRRLLHRRIAEALEALYGRELDAFSAELAAHYEQAGVPEHALRYHQQAAEVAQRIHANEEAIAHLNRALVLLATCAGGPQRDEREIGLRILLGPSLVAARGWADPEVGRVYQQARSLCGPHTDPAQLLPILWGLWTFHIVQAELETTRDLGGEFLRLARLHEDPILLAAAHLANGYSLFHLGEMERAREHFEQATSHSTSTHLPHAGLFGPDLGVFSLSYTSHVLWHLGDLETALKRSRQALARAKPLAHPFSQAIALNYAAMLHQFCRDAESACTYADAAIALCEEYGFAYYRAWGTIIRGWAWCEQGKLKEGQAAMQQGLDALSATGARLRRPYHLALLAEVAGKSGDLEGELSLLEEALMVAHTYGERWQEAELHRLKGELLLEQDADEAARCFRSAFDLAHRQHARSLMLRAALSLHRLRQHDPDNHDSRALLQAAYDAFTEGLDTADLKEAHALLEETP